ncbi:MAG: DsbE family thiol:disulfide interchange protein [Alphaproteobacteria bacterium]|nr:DsbE family thiol:disulfide interchange protein [Alphaproteobacteria bacterium]
MSDDPNPALPGPAGCARIAGRPGYLRKRLLLLVPFVGVLAFGIAFYFMLGRNPHLVPSVLIGRPVPQFNLPPVQGRHVGLSSADLRGDVSLVNVFASWCVACRAEHPLLVQLQQSGIVTVDGLDYKDPPDDAAKWLDTMGDPYTRTGADISGRVAIDWGVYGVPETYVVDPQGRIAFKQIGPITPEILDQTILPLVNRLRGRSREHAR